MGAISQMSMWNLSSFLNGLADKLGSWGGGLCIVLGAAMILVAIFKIGKGLMSERSQTNWVMCFVLLFVGGIMAGGGAYTFLHNAAVSGGDELRNLG